MSIIHAGIMSTPLMVVSTHWKHADTECPFYEFIHLTCVLQADTHSHFPGHWWLLCCSRTVASRWRLWRRSRGGKLSPSSLAVDGEADGEIGQIKTMSGCIVCTMTLLSLCGGQGLALAPQSTCCLQWHWLWQQCAFLHHTLLPSLWLAVLET